MENVTTVIKRDSSEVPFDGEKIYSAIYRSMANGSGIINEKIARKISDEIETMAKSMETISVSQIEKMVFDKLIEYGQKSTARNYEGYRAVHEYLRSRTKMDKEIEGIVEGTDQEALDENSNKKTTMASTQRDLIAGVVSKDYCKRNIFPEDVVIAHEQGIIHVNDLDYTIEKVNNCCLINLEDMLQNGTVINKVMIRRPKSLHVACTVATQIIQQVASGQYGGQTINIAHLAPFVRVSYNKHLKKYKRRGETKEKCEQYAKEDLADEIRGAVQTIQYQVNTFDTSNGQSPFLSIFMYISDNPEYEEETAMLIEEILRQRTAGLENEFGIPITPAFPKLLYVTDENNIYPGSKYFELTVMAAKCITKRMMPDCISAKIMREKFDGEVFGCMGCRSFLGSWKDENGKYKWWGRFNQGVVTLNLADVGLSAKGDMNKFIEILDTRLALCKKALMAKHNRLKTSSTEVSPIHWKYGAMSRILDSESFEKLLYGGYSSLSLGYAGLYECIMALIGESHTTEKGKKLAHRIMGYLDNTCKKWKQETNIGFSLYGTPLETTTYKFATSIRERFGIIEGITDHDYITNSYHVNVREEISPEDKLTFEAEMQNYSLGGCVSYIETCNLNDNPEIIIKYMQFMYEHIMYAEFNGKFDFCGNCGFEGEIKLVEDGTDLVWECPQCGCRDRMKMHVTRRTCGYIGTNYWNKGRTQEIRDRYVHIDNKDLEL